MSLSFLFAQDAKKTDYEGFKLGVKFGGNFSTGISGFGTDNFKDSGGDLLYGAIFQIPIYKPLYLQIETLRTKIRTKYNYEEGTMKKYGLSSSSSWDLDYISIPVLAKMKFLKILNIQYGIQYDYLTRAEFESEEFLGHELIEGISKFNFSQVYGLGVDFKGGAFIDFKYVVGLRNIIKQPIDYYGDTISEMKTRYFALSIGYRH
ncbi:outer membrane beta-barrel protein [Wenyingzhuangia sp. IMCC45574]